MITYQSSSSSTTTPSDGIEEEKNITKDAATKPTIASASASIDVLHSNSNSIGTAVSLEVSNIIVYVIYLVLFMSQWIFEFFLVRQSESEHTYIFYIILFYNVASVVANFFWFVCHKKVARHAVSNPVEFLVVFIESAIYFCRHALRLLSMYYIGCGVTASLLPIYVALLILCDYLFDGVFSFYHKRRSSLVLLLAIVAVLPTFVYNSSIYSQPAGSLMALCWISAETLDLVVRYILEFSMSSYVASKNWCGFRRSRSSLATASLVLTEQVDPTLAQVKCTNFNNYSIQWYNNAWGILLSLIGIFLFEVDHYTAIMEQQQEIVGYVTIATALHTLSTMAYIAYMNRVTRSRRLTAEDPMLKALIMFVLFNVIFVSVVQVWQVVFQFVSLCFFTLYLIVRMRDQAADKKAHSNASAVKFESEDVVP